MEPVKLGVIGLGGRGHGLAMMLRDCGQRFFQVAAVSDLFRNKAEAAARDLALPESAVFSDHRELLARAEVEAVLVETGTDAMVPICCDALAAGKHVCADVPMMDSVRQCWDLIVTVERTGLVYCMGEQVRFANFTEQWRRHVREGLIGAPLFIQGEYIHPETSFYFERRDTGQPDHPSIAAAVASPDYQKTWRNRFRHPIKYIPHELSPLLKILDDRVVRVSCLTSDTRLYGDAVEMLDFECAVMHTAKGRTLRIANSFTAPRNGKWSHHWYHIMGTDGVLETARPGWLSGDPAFAAASEIIFHRDGRVERTNYGWARAESPFGDSSAGHAGLEAFVFKQFHDSIRQGAENELNVYTAAEAELPGLLAAQSAEQGGVLLEVPDVRPNAARPAGARPLET